MFSWTEFQEQCYETSAANGFHEGEEYGISDLRIMSALMLGVTEQAEAAEAVRIGDWDNFIEELADVCIRTGDLAEMVKQDGRVTKTLGQAIGEKMEKNKKRSYKHGGKKL